MSAAVLFLILLAGSLFCCAKQLQQRPEVVSAQDSSDEEKSFLPQELV